MAGKARVHELAKELGVTSKDVLKKLADLGEYVKSASSTVEAPVARKLRDSFPSDTAKAPYANGAPASGPASASCETICATSSCGAAISAGISASAPTWTGREATIAASAVRLPRCACAHTAGAIDVVRPGT